MGLSRTVSEINGDFSLKSQISPTPGVFDAPLKGFTLGIGDLDQRTRMMGLYRAKNKFDDIFSCLDTIHEHDR